MYKNPSITAEFAGTLVPTQSHVAMYSTQEIIKMAFKALGICWLVALVIAFVPLVHLVLTPVALVAGPFSWALVYYKTRKLPRRVQGTVLCNHCKQETAFDFERVSPRFYAACSQCNTGYEVLWPPAKGTGA